MKKKQTDDSISKSDSSPELELILKMFGQGDPEKEKEIREHYKILDSIKDYLEINENLSISDHMNKVQLNAYINTSYDMLLIASEPGELLTLNEIWEIVKESGRRFMYYPLSEKPYWRAMKVFCDLIESMKDQKIHICCKMSDNSPVFISGFLNRVLGEFKADDGAIIEYSDLSIKELWEILFSTIKDPLLKNDMF